MTAHVFNGKTAGYFVAHFATGKLEIVAVWDNELCLARLAQW